MEFWSSRFEIGDNHLADHAAINHLADHAAIELQDPDEALLPAEDRDPHGFRDGTITKIKRAIA